MQPKMTDPVQKARLIPASELENNADQLAELEAATFEQAWSKAQLLASLQNHSTLFAITNQSTAHNLMLQSLPEGCDIIAYLLLQFFPGQDCAEILRIATHPNWQRQGHAASLLKLTQDWLQTQASQSTGLRLLLEVAHKNYAALALYKKFGFAIIHTRREYYGDQDALVLEWQCRATIPGDTR